MKRPWTQAPLAVRAILGAATVALLVFTFTKHRVGANVLSRFITVERLLDAGSFSHDGTRFERSVDAVMVDGKMYSSKPPTYSLALALSAWPVRALTGARVYEHQRAYLHYLVLVHQVLPYLLLLWVAWRWVSERSTDPWVQSMVLVGLSFAALPFGYAVTLNNHTPAAVFLFFTWWACHRVLEERAARPGLTALSVGILGGLAASYELTAGIFTPLFGLVLAGRSFRFGVWVALGAVLASVPMFATYYGISGSFVPFYLQRDLYDFPGGYWRNPTGMDALNDPTWLYAFHSLLGHHGLFSLSPLLAVGAIGLVWHARERRWMSWATLAGSVVVILYIVLTTNNYGGRTLGMRWFAQLVPLWSVSMLPVLEWARERPWARRVCYALAALSAAIVIEALIQNTFSPGGWVYGLEKVL